MPGVFAMLAVAACGSSGGSSSAADNSPTIANMLQDATVAGNDTIIDLDGVFAGGSGPLTLDASLGSIGADGMLTLSDSVFIEGTHTLTIIATDANSNTARMTVELVSDKTPTIDTALGDANIDSNGGTIIDLDGVFDNGSGMLTLTASAGMIGIGSSFTLVGSDLVDGANTITVTARDADGDAITDVFEINTTKTISLIDDAVITIYGALQHSTQTFNLGEVFAITKNTTLSTSTLPSGISLNNNTLSFANADVSEGAQAITLTATEGDVTLSHTLTYALDTIKDQSGDTSTIYTGTTLADAITGNAFAEDIDDISNVNLDGGAGNDTISDNTLTASGDNTFTSLGNNFLGITPANWLSSITFDGGDGNDTINDNNLTSDHAYVQSITFDGGAGNDTISGNGITAGNGVLRIFFDGGAGNDTISGNTIIASGDVTSITFHGGDGNDTISDNIITASDDVTSITLMGGVGNDVFRDNAAVQTSGGLAQLTIDGGDGEDTVVFRSIAAEYSGIADWVDEVTTITLTGDGAVVTLINVETIAFADDGTSFSAADTWVEGNEGVLYDLTNAFPDAETTFTAYSTDTGNIGNDSTLALAGTELAHGRNTIVLTATASDGMETTETIAINAIKKLRIDWLKQHDLQPIDLNAIFVDAHTYTYTSTLPGGINLENSTLSFDNDNLSNGTYSITITATDGSDASNVIVGVHTLTLALDTINGQSGGGASTTYTGTTLADAITGNTFAEASDNLINVSLEGGAGNDTISENTLTASDDITSITFDGGDDHDTISDNTLNASDDVFSITFHGGDGNDAISGNTLTASDDVFSITFHGGDGNDTISGNIITAQESASNITFLGGDGDDTITANTINGITTTANELASNITFHGGDGNDTITANTITSKGSAPKITFHGGDGNDLFRDNSAIHDSDQSAALAIDGGNGEDTVVFRSFTDAYMGITDWMDGVTTITINSDEAATTLIDVETISFADGASYNANDRWVEDNVGISYDLANEFSDAETTFTAYSSDRGTIVNDTTLTLAYTELAHGTNTIVLTATATDNTETTKSIAVNVLKTLRIVGAEQHDQQTIDLDAIFVDANAYTYTSTETHPSGISLNDSTLSFDNTGLNEGIHAITITATDGDDVGTHTLTYALDTIVGQSGNKSFTTYTGTTLADAITGNSFANTSYNLLRVVLDGGVGNDTISDNNLTASKDVYRITFDGGEGNDTISGNSITASDDAFFITFHGGDGNDTISGNSITASDEIKNITFDGGADNDTISGNTLTASNKVFFITFHGGDGNDAISDNHFETTDQGLHDDVYDVTLMGGTGDDVFRDNTATQANSERSSLTIDGGAGTDKVYFALESSMFTITGSYGSPITVTDKDARTDETDGVDSYAEYVLIDIEELYFADALHSFLP